MYALHLDLDPSAVDVNVHPQKKEVRFADEEWVRMLIQESISETLFGKRTSVPYGADPQPPVEPMCLNAPVRQTDSWFTIPDLTTEQPPRPHPDRGLSPRIEQYQPSLLDQGETKVGPAAHCLTVVGDIAIIQTTSPEGLPAFPSGQESPPRDVLIVLDLKQTMRTIMLRELEQNPTPSSTELFLVPIAIDCAPQEAALVRTALSQFEQLGFVIRPFGPNSFLVEGAPSQFNDVDIKKFILDAVHEDAFSVNSVQQNQRMKRLSSLYVASMKTLRPPIAPQTALAIFNRWIAQGTPQIAPDGNPCSSLLTPRHLKEYIAGETLSHGS